LTDEMRVSFGFPLRVAVASDVGRVRTNNEDSHGSAWLPDGSLFVIVADGMGGHEAGEVASGLAVQVLEEVVSRDMETDPRERLYRGLLEANEAILQEGRASGTRGMGTTAVATLLRGCEVHVGLVGDSRLYHIRRGQLLWRTLDHTRVQMLIEQGQVPELAARSHPESGMLTRALGHSKMADGRPLVPDVLAEPLVIDRDDALVMCSDGLHDLLEDWEIGRVVSGREPAEAAAELVRLAVERGGHDNITVAVISAGERTSPFDESYVPDVGADVPPPPPEGEVLVEPTIDGSALGAAAPLQAHPIAAPPPPPAPPPPSPPAASHTSWQPPLVVGGPHPPVVDGGPHAPVVGGSVEPNGAGPAALDGSAPLAAPAEEEGPDAATQEAGPPGSLAPEAPGAPPPAPPRPGTPPRPAGARTSAERRLPAAPQSDEAVRASGTGRWMVGGVVAMAMAIVIGLVVLALVALLAGTAIFAM
jgi:PPM family protein phosphatase